MESSLASARAGAGSRRSPEKLLGCETPRIFTPPLRPLTPETSLGFECIAFADDVLGITLLPWQKWLLVHALELLPDGEFRFRTVVLLVARQSGKSTLMLVLTLWRMFLDRSQLVIGTAQNLDLSEELWNSAVDLVESIPELAAEVPRDGVVRNNGKKALRLKTGERYKVAAASRKGGRGFSGDLILMDELREHHSFDSWSAVTKTTMARPRAQIWAASNAGDAMSIVLRRLRAIAHQALDWPDGDGDSTSIGSVDDVDESDGDEDSLGIFEWSAEPNCSRSDRAAWAQANPSLGYTISERAIAGALRTDPDSVFRTEVLCQWISTAESGPFTAGKWIATQDNDARPAKSSPRVLCVDVSWNRETAYIARVSRDRDGNPVLDIAAQRAGTEWVAEWLSKRRKKFESVTLQTNGAPVSSLYDELKKPKYGLNVVDWSGPDLGRASGIAFDLVENETLRHLQHPGLDRAATTAVPKSMGDTWVIDRKNSPNDAAPLIASIGALWLLDQESAEPSVSAYEDSDLIVL